MDSLELKPIRRAAGKVRLPGSKSISNRVLLLAALASGDTEVSGLLDADDTRVMRGALSKLGVRFLKRRVRGVVARWFVAGLPMRPRRRHAAVRGRRRWPGAGASAHDRTRDELHRRVAKKGLRRTGRSARRGTPRAFFPIRSARRLACGGRRGWRPILAAARTSAGRVFPRTSAE